MKTKKILNVLFSSLLVLTGLNQAYAQDQKETTFLIARYVSNGLSPAIVQTVKLQTPNPQEQNKMLKAIGDYKFFYTLIFDTKRSLSYYKLDSVAKVEGIVPAGNSVFVLTDSNGDFKGKEIFTGEEYYFYGNKNDFNWEITSDKKKIGKYNCTKANLKSLMGASVWFTTEIPVAAGPDIYQGLPGLVLEVEGTFEKTDLLSVNFNESHKDINENALKADFDRSKPLAINQVFSSKNNFIQMVRKQLETGKKR